MHQQVVDHRLIEPPMLPDFFSRTFPSAYSLYNVDFESFKYTAKSLLVITGSHICLTFGILSATGCKDKAPPLRQ